MKGYIVAASQSKVSNIVHLDYQEAVEVCRLSNKMSKSLLKEDSIMTFKVYTVDLPEPEEMLEYKANGVLIKFQAAAKSFEDSIHKVCDVLSGKDS